MSCSTISKNGTPNKVVAMNGNISELYLSLLKIPFMTNSKETWDLYNGIMSPEFLDNNLELDDNREPLLYYAVSNDKNGISYKLFPTFVEANQNRRKGESIAMGFVKEGEKHNFTNGNEFVLSNNLFKITEWNGKVTKSKSLPQRVMNYIAEGTLTGEKVAFNISLDELKPKEFNFTLDYFKRLMNKLGNENLISTDVEEMNRVARENGYEDFRAMVSVWHGSPYDFERFTTEKMGTGEGVQAFGWGLYFTDLESIAKTYANNENLIERHLNSVYEFGVPDRFYQIPEERRKNKESLITYIDTQIEGFRGNTFQQQEWQKLKDAIASYTPNLYKVSLQKDKTPDQYTWLEWDKPVSEEVYEKLNELQRPKNQTGSQLYKSLSETLGGDKNTSEYLLDLGIDGIKYPAESISRGATSDTARGFNYVVFDENAITIEEKIKFIKKPNGQIYGMFVPNYKGQGPKIFINPEIANNATTIEEIGHLQYYMLDIAAKNGDSEAQKILAKGEELFGEIADKWMGVKGEGGVSENRYQIIGEKGAKALDDAEEATFRMDNLQIAREMEQAGKDAKTIRLSTGWERQSMYKNMNDAEIINKLLDNGIISITKC